MQNKSYVLRLFVAYFSISINTCVQNLIFELSENGLTHIPDYLNVTVTHLILHSNNITRIERYSLYNYTSLKWFDVAVNNITFIHTDAFIWTPELYYLRVSRNILLSPGPWMKALVPNLEKLHIAHINFHAISELESFNLTALKRLGMSNNKIHSPDFTPLGGHLTDLTMRKCDAYNIIGLIHLRQLNVFKLTSNNLVTLPDLFNKSLSQLHMAENPWHCDFRLCWVRMWTIAKSSGFDLDNPVCDSPPDLSGIALMDVHPCDMDCHVGKRTLSTFLGPILQTVFI